jgi:hypothetical protein
MREKEPQFTVTDRRKFTSEGDLREDDAAQGESRASGNPPAAAGRREGPPAKEIDKTREKEEEKEKDVPMPGPTMEESARQSSEYHESARRLDEMLEQANVGASAGPQMDFERLVQSLYMTAAVQMGAGAAPNEQPQVDIVGARQSIDMLGVLAEKTKGNLTEGEKRLLQNVLFDLRMSFLEITNAITSSAARGAKPGKGK